MPRAAIPLYLAKVQEVAQATGSLIVGCGHAGDGNVHLSVLQGDPEVRTKVVGDVLAAGVALGGAVSGEHGIGTEKKKYLAARRGPGQARPHAPHQGRLRPRRDPQPRRHLRLRPGGTIAMNGANALIRTLVDAGVDVCFMNPGTSEMHFVAALDDVPEMRGVLALFEGVATGAADGYARIAGRPAATLLHLGPGLGNGLANLHNAAQGVHADRQHRRRPRHLPQAVRRPARVRHRDRRAQRVELDPVLRQHQGGRRPTPPTPSPRRSVRPARSRR